MVRVPLPQEPGRVAGTGGYSAPGISPPAINAGAQTEQLGNVLTRAGLGVSDRAAALQETLHIAAVKEAQALAEERIGEAERAYLSAIGKAATGEGRKRADTELEAKLRAIEGGLGHEVERTLFRQVMGRRMTDVRARWGRHEDEQARVYEIGTSKAVLEGHIDAARRGGTQSDGTSMRAAKAEATMLAAKLGYGPEQTDQLVREATTAVHSGIVQDLATAGRGSEARSYLAGVEGEVDAESLGRLRGVVQRASLDEEGARTAVSVRDGLAERLVQTPVTDQAIVLRNEGVARIQALWEDGKITVEVRNRAFAEMDRMAKARAAEVVQMQDGAARAAEQWLIDNPLASVEALPPALYEQARGLGILGDLNGFSGSSKRYSTNPELFTQLYLPRGNGWFDKPQAEFVAAMRRQLSPDDLRAAMAMYAAANKYDDPKALRGASFEERVKQAAASLGYFTAAGQTPEQRQEIGARIFALREDAARRVNALKQPGREATPEEEQLGIDQAVQDQVYVDQAGSDPIRPVGALSLDELTGMTQEEREQLEPGGGIGRRGAYVDADLMAKAWQRLYRGKPVPSYITNSGLVYVGEIDQAVRARIASKLASQGVPVTEAAIATLWAQAGRPRSLREVQDAERYGRAAQEAGVPRIIETGRR